MPSGEKTSEEVVLKFAEQYLRMGSPSQAGRAVGLPASTSYDIAERLDNDPDFVRRRKRIREAALDRAEAAVMRSIDTLADRLENAQELLSGRDGAVTIIDKSADYGKSIAALADTLLKRAKFDFDTSPDKPQNGPVEIVIKTASVADAASE